MSDSNDDSTPPNSNPPPCPASPIIETLSVETGIDAQSPVPIPPLGGIRTRNSSDDSVIKKKARYGDGPEAESPFVPIQQQVRFFLCGCVNEENLNGPMPPPKFSRADFADVIHLLNLIEDEDEDEDDDEKEEDGIDAVADRERADLSNLNKTPSKK